MKTTAAAGAVLSVHPRVLSALSQQQLLTRAIPGTSERLPAVGLGSSATFSTVARSEDYSALREVLASLVENGATVSSLETRVNVLEGLLEHERAIGGSARVGEARRRGEAYLLGRRRRVHQCRLTPVAAGCPARPRAEGHQVRGPTR